MAEQKEIVIVSGLPRSGTSLMMQMLADGGIEPMTDEIREADTDNPRGYYEFERVKRIKEDQSWLPDARGKVVKMISQLLYDLPETESFKIVFMRRDLGEIVASQEKMLARRGNPIPPADKIAAAFEKHLERLFAWLPNQKELQVHQVNYNELVSKPRSKIVEITKFLGGNLDHAKMFAAIDPNLYRNRNRNQKSAS